MTDFTTLYFDIETAYELLGSWGGLYDLDRLFTIRDVQILSIAWAKNDEPVRCKAVWDFPGYKPGETHLDDKKLVRFIYEKILPETDMWVGHNAIDFDFRLVRTRGIAHNFAPPPIAIERDTKRMAKQIGRFTSNKQDNVLRQLGLEKVRKLDTGGLQLWRECIAGNPVAQKKMKQYNSRDVVGLREMHKRLEPWMKTGVNMNVVHDTKLRCVNCLSDKLTMKGFRYRLLSKYRWYRCNACGSCRTRGGNLPSHPVLR